MTTESRTFQVGQEVRVSYTARVAEVGSTHPHREGRLVRLETSAIPTGWVDPEQEGLSIEVTSVPLPTQPGLYATFNPAKDDQGQWTFDGYQFYYLNSHASWCDVGWGQPDPTDAALLVRWMPLPF